MQITGSVKSVISGSGYQDKRQRIRIHLDGADSCFNEVVVPNDGEFDLDERVSVTIVAIDDVTQ